MGDLNADGSYFDEDSISDLDAYYWVIDDSQDTTTMSTDYTYDRIILTLQVNQVCSGLIWSMVLMKI